MKIQESDFYYGVVLAQIAEFPTFTSINKSSRKEGLYTINTYIDILVKYSTSDNGEWRFAISRNDIEEASQHDGFMVFVCAGNTICPLRMSELANIIDIDSILVQTISITYPPGGQMRVRGPLGKLPYKIAHNIFPNNLFEGQDGHRIIDETYAWPPFSKLNLYSQLPKWKYSTEDRMFDLVDILGTDFSSPTDRTVYLGLSTISSTWEAWTEDKLIIIESRIRYLLECDGYAVDIERVTDPICPYTKKQNITCKYEFVWKLLITDDVDLKEESDEDNNSIEVETIEEQLKSDTDKISDSEIRPISGSFPNLVYAKGKSVSPIEIDVDFLAKEKEFECGGWEDKIKQLTSTWVKNNSYTGSGTIWAWGGQSCNFNHQNYSMFYAVLGMPKAFREYLGNQVQLALGNKFVRPYSDFVVPKTSEGWDARCHIEDGKTWGIWDASTWKEIKE